MEGKDLQQLIEGCIKQDRHSQELLYKGFYGFAMKICLRYAANRYDASEVLNDGFFKVFTNIEKYDTNWPFKSWLSKIMLNTAIDYYRSNLRWSQMANLDKSDYTMNEATVEHKLGYEDLLGVIQRLPPAYRLIFNLYAIDGYSHEEIAEMVGISASTSRSNLHKARQKLQQMLTVPKSIIAFFLFKYMDKKGQTNGNKP